MREVSVFGSVSVVEQDGGLTFQDVFVDLERGARIPEWGETTQHFEDQDTQRPPDERGVSKRHHHSKAPKKPKVEKADNSPINTLIVPLRTDHLWRKVIRRSAQGPGDIRHLLCEAEVGDL